MTSPVTCKGLKRLHCPSEQCVSDLWGNAIGEKGELSQKMNVHS